MREIKFRAWNKEERKYYHKEMDYIIRCLSTPSCEALGLSGEEYDEKMGWIGYNELTYLTWDIEQYTGLKDKNGVEIYEGDIVRVENILKITFDYTVEYKKGCFMGIDNNSHTPLVDRYKNQFETIEVIGNIHEV